MHAVERLIVVLYWVNLVKLLAESQLALVEF